jgi:hypothetical protein
MLCEAAYDIQRIVTARRITGDVAEALRAAVSPSASACHSVLPDATTPVR